ncbi:hypothetical protein MMC28_006696 [Mycoblastus sanguinarius]|nr:hypothetical protein [Mycoblastus sanguinarius]
MTSFTNEIYDDWVLEGHDTAVSIATSLITTNHIRLIAIIGGYCLLRPYLLQLALRFQASDFDEPAEAMPMPSKSCDDHLEGFHDDEKDIKARANWGPKATRRQRLIITKSIDAQVRYEIDQAGASSGVDIEGFIEG